MSTAMYWWVLALAVAALVAVVVFGARAWLRADDEWTVPAWRTTPSANPDYDGDGWDWPATDPAEPDEWDDEWEQLDPDLAAETLIAEWHDEGNETTAITGQMNVLDDLRLLAWDAGRQVSMIKTLRAAYRAEMAWTLDWYRDALEHRPAT